jgi:hypothetical protein
MTIAAMILVAAAAVSWIAVRRCPLARAIRRHIDQVAAASR